MSLSLLKNNKCFGGWQKQYSHPSQSVNCTMTFSIYLPPQVLSGKKVPVLYWLSGLTCTDENFVTKAGAQQIAAELGIAIVAPDTSPRGDNVADDPSYDLGYGAGFYVNATEAPWDKHYQMYSYVTEELPTLIEQHFPVTSQRSISGHSMGGHGALMIALRNPENYQSVSAFSPISNPLNCAWGHKAFETYLGKDRKTWEQYDASLSLARSNASLPILVDQGSSDEFLENQLNPESLSKAATESSTPLELRMQEGYDHSYFFISSFIHEHLAFHAEHLQTK
ncbi:S-formylglutathione hydrolase [Alteromonadaceae bacterium M269]|nr:S-formylglutathione hydrolase [Alteromonadaceae bacterium M269]